MFDPVWFSKFVWAVNLLGLIVSTLGAILIYKGTPVDTGGIYFFSYGDENAPEKLKEIERRKKLSIIGLQLLIGGFVCQLIAVLLQYPS